MTTNTISAYFATSVTTFVVKLIIAVALTIAVITGSGVVAEQVGLDVTPSAYACGNSSGGGC